MADPTKKKHTGGCQCGSIRYVLREDPTNPSICHCRMCQKAAGGPFGVFIGLNRKALVWTRGAPATFRTSSTSKRGYCADCGTSLTYDFIGGDRINITLYSLDVPSNVDQPERQIGTESRAPWLDKINTFPGKTTDVDSGIDFVNTCVIYQHPDHDTSDDWTPPQS